MVALVGRGGRRGEERERGRELEGAGERSRGRRKGREGEG